jgi:hypothetical protein
VAITRSTKLKYDLSLLWRIQNELCLPWQAEAIREWPNSNTNETTRQSRRESIEMSLRDRVDPVRIMTIIFATVFVVMILWIAFQEL